MPVRVPCVIACLAALTGCVSLDSRDMVVAPRLVGGSHEHRSQSRAGAAVTVASVAGSERLEQLLAAIDLLRSRGSAEQGTSFRGEVDNASVMDTGSKAAEDLLLEPAVREVVAAMVEAREAAERGTPTTRSTSISTTSLFDLGHALGSARDSMLDDLVGDDMRPYSEMTVAEGRAMLAGPAAARGKPTFARVLAIYYKALANGKFVDRRGQQLAKLEYSDGIGSEALGELVTVFFEALFDHALCEELPLYYEIGEGTVVLEPLFHPVTVVGGSYVVDTDPAKVQDLGGPGDARSDVLMPAYVRRSVKIGEKTYLLADGKTPTAVVAKIVQQVDIVGNPDGITEEQLEAIRTISNFAGQRAKGASGLVFGFLGKIDVSFVLGAGFSVGDNKTLQELVTAVAEVASRRVSEWAAYSIAREWNLQGGGMAPRDLRINGEPFWERINDLPGADDVQVR